MGFLIILVYLEVSGVLHNLIAQTLGTSDYIVIVQKPPLVMMENATDFQ
jgi:hypothetical protein